MTTHLKKNHKKRAPGMAALGSTAGTPTVGETPEACTITASLFDKYHPGYFGQVGMRYFHRLRNKFYCPTVNVDKLWSLLLEDVKEKAGSGSASMIDVGQFGYFKVLGEGRLSEGKALVVKAKLVSKTTEKMIKEGGGVVVLTA